MSSPTGTPTPHIPSHSGPRVWFLTSGTAPIAIALADQLLEHGDHVVAGLPQSEINALHQQSDDNSDRLEGLRELLSEFGDVVERSDGEDRGRLRVVALDIRSLIGTVEELSTPPQSVTLIREQFETNFFGPVNIIKAALPTLRSQRSGHILVLTGTSKIHAPPIKPYLTSSHSNNLYKAGHLGTPGLGIYCASNWAIEGFCDVRPTPPPICSSSPSHPLTPSKPQSLAYEIAPFNLKLSILQPNLEISVLSNKLTSAPPLPAYSPSQNPAPLSREIIGNLVSRLHQSSSTPNPSPPPPSEQLKHPNLSDPAIVSLYPPLPASFREALLAETVYALTAIGGHENPPARHIVGYEAVTSVKEKLKTVSEELEDFVGASTAVDIERHGDGVARRDEEG
ncbi:MAG: hypothetical protein M1835_002202 [Candelina submexicana]|nr:MAG: hypothetical protein M1835_002202 [Candelina submexicana]